MSNPLDLKRYELMVILDADNGETAVKKQLDKIRKLISSKGEIAYEEIWGLKRLAYPIKKKSDGSYAVFDFAVEPEFIKDLDRTLRLDTEVLRHLITVLPKNYEPKDYVALAEAEKKEAELNQVTDGKQVKKLGGARRKTETVRTDRSAKSSMRHEGTKDTGKPSRTEDAPVTKKIASKTETAESAPKKATAKVITKKDSKQSLDDIDAKLSSIIDNPDISI